MEVERNGKEVLVVCKENVKETERKCKGNGKEVKRNVGEIRIE